MPIFCEIGIFMSPFYFWYPISLPYYLLAHPLMTIKKKYKPLLKYHIVTNNDG